MLNKMINQKLENKSFESSNDEQMHLGLGVIFIKSRKSDDKIWGEIDEMKALAESTYIEVVDVIVDESSGCDVDRTEIDDLMDWIENSPVGIILLKSIYDICKDPDDLVKFLEKAKSYQMIIVDMNANCVISPFAKNDEE